MDLALNEIQTLLQNSAKEFMEAEMPKSRVLEIDDSPSGFSVELWQQMCELGWAGMVIPERYGGSGNSFTDLGVLYEVQGYYACTSPHLSTSVLAAQAILAAGSEPQREAMLPAIASGQQIFAFAVTEPEYGWSPADIQLPAVPRGDGFVLNGVKLFIPDANVADQLVVAARTGPGSRTGGEGIGLFVVDKNSPGVSVRVQTGWIGPKVCEVAFDNVEVPASGVLGPAGGAWPAIESSLDKGTAALSMYMAGGTQRVHDMALEYSQTRMAFGVPIGTFQRVQDHVIDALTEADAAKWSSYEALSQVDEGAQPAPSGAGAPVSGAPVSKEAQVSISMAKAIASVGFAKACDASHMVHAGIGTDLDFGLTQYTKRARTLQHYLGDAAFHKARMARLLRS